MDKASTLGHNWNWDGRIDDPNDDQANRIHQSIKQVTQDDLSNHPRGITLLGYACDEGVRRNKGRVGASDGPNAIRKALGSMALHTDKSLYDLGDCVCKEDQMEITQVAFANNVKAVLSSNNKLIGLGGGHDIAYAHGSGIYNYLNNSNQKLGIINLDAHFDLRQPTESTNSGTPFYQLAQEHRNNFNYLTVGVQKYGNTQRLFTTAKDLGTTYLLREDLQFNLAQSLDKIRSFVQTVDQIYLTIDLDGIDASICPGVSAPSINGMTLDEILVIIDVIIDSNKLLSMDLAELNPGYDKDHKTAKVAAFLIHRIISIWE